MGGVSRRNIAAFPITSVDWGGSTGGSWNQASNWAPGIIPNSTLDVAIASGSPLMDVDYTLPVGKSLTLSGTGSLTIAAGKALTVAGTADFGGKSVTFRSHRHRPSGPGDGYAEQCHQRDGRTLPAFRSKMANVDRSADGQFEQQRLL